MHARTIACIASAMFLTALAIVPVQGGDWPLGWKAEPGTPNTLPQIARSIDYIEEKILDDGLVVIKQPDVWGQSRMTLYRKDFENMMRAQGPNDFKEILAARVARLDSATLESQTALGASLSAPGAAAAGSRRRGMRAPAAGTAGSGAANAVTSPTVIAIQHPSSTKPAHSGGSGTSPDSGGGSGGAGDSSGGAADLLKTPLPSVDEPFSLLTNKAPFQKLDDKLGLEPTVFLDEKKRYFDHLNELRRVNIGDDNADSAGYGLYLIRMPVSIQPGECTLQGYGAILNVTARHEFDENFLKKTFHNLVVNDLVDQLGPIVYELIRNGVIEKVDEDTTRLNKLRQEYFKRQMEYATRAKEQQASKDELKSKRALLDRTINEIVGRGTRSAVSVAINTKKAEYVALLFHFARATRSVGEAGASKAIDTGAGTKAVVKTVEQRIKDAISDINIALRFTKQSSTDLDAWLNSLNQVTSEKEINGPPNAGVIRKDLTSVETALNGLEAALEKIINERTAKATVATPDDGLGKKANAPLADTELALLTKPMTSAFDSTTKYEKDITNWDSSDPFLTDSITELNRKFKVQVKHLADLFFQSVQQEEKCLQSVRPMDSCAALNHLQMAIRSYFDELRKRATQFDPTLISAIQSAPNIEQSLEKVIKDLDGLEKTSDQGLLSVATLATSLLNLNDNLTSQARKIAGLTADVEKQSESMVQLQAGVMIERVASWAFPSTRFGARTYPIAPSDIDDVFLRDCILKLVRKTREALPTEVPRATDVRNYIRHELESAYDLIESYQGDIEPIQDLIERREFAKLRNDAFPKLVVKLPGDLKGQPDDVLSILSWSVAVECGLLDRQLKRDIKATANLKANQVQHGFECPDLTSVFFYDKDPSPEAEEVFEHYVRGRWPMIVFALDPFVDQQNIADAFSLRRDLQLALAFSFATGKVNFSQLDRYNRKIEQDAETIALNRTVTSFSHGSDTFGWRFYPRYQNPPPERSNIQTISNLLIRGGSLGRNYQMNNSKLEAGQRELTAVIIMPSFLERVRFDVTGNWFPLHDPDQMKIHTARMIEQGRSVMLLRQSLATPDLCEHYRPDDLERLKSRVDQVEAMLPMQTRRVQVPYENAMGGFQLFTPGSTALVPEIIGYEGIESVEEGKATDIMIFGKHFSLHETKVVVGGKVLVPDDLTPATTKSLAGTQVDIVSRELIHLKLPADVRPTMIRNVIDKELAKKEGLKPAPYVELFLGTPTGLSNRLLIPFKPKQKTAAAATEPSTPVEAGYVLLDTILKIQGSITPTQPPKSASDASKSTVTQTINLTIPNATTSTPDGSPSLTSNAAHQSTPKPAGGSQPADATKQTKSFTPAALSYQSWDKIRILPTQPPANESDTIDVELHFPVEKGVYISVKASDVPFKDNAFVVPPETLTVIADDFLKKLNAYGKLVGPGQISQLESSSVLITLKGADGPPRATHNPLKVEVLLFTEQEPAATVATPATDPAGSSPATPAAAPGKPTIPSPISSATIVDPSVSKARLLPQPRLFGQGSPNVDKPDPLPALPRELSPSSQRAPRSTSSTPQKGIATKAMAKPRPASTPPAAPRPASDRPARRSILSRITGQ
jgi:hypothetical protein